MEGMEVVSPHTPVSPISSPLMDMPYGIRPQYDYQRSDIHHSGYPHMPYSHVFDPRQQQQQAVVGRFVEGEWGRGRASIEGSESMVVSGCPCKFVC